MTPQIWKPPPNWRENLAQNIRVCRTLRRMTQFELSEIFQTSSNTISVWEKSGKLQLTDFIRLCSFFDKPPDFMLSQHMGSSSKEENEYILNVLHPNLIMTNISLYENSENSNPTPSESPPPAPQKTEGVEERINKLEATVKAFLEEQKTRNRHIETENKSA